MRFRTNSACRVAGAALLAAILLAACGGGGSDTPAAAAPPPPTSTSLPSSDSLANICTVDGEKQFTRSYLDEVYLWYSEIPSVNAALYNNVPDYFYALLTPQLDANGLHKDRFSFVVSSADADSLLTGSNLGYGVRWERDAQGRTRVAFVDAGSPAAAAGLQRGGELAGTATANPDWYPNANASITFTYRSTPGAATSTVTLTTAAVQEDPVPSESFLATANGRQVAYVLFNAHTQGAQDKLIGAVKAAQTAGAQDVVLDMRYNGGGYLYTAISLASMIASPGTDGRIAEQLRYNDKRPQLTAESTFLFSGQVEYGEQVYGQGTALPRLSLPRVYVLATGHTCSASESVINSLRGIGVDVVLVGGTTCGKPYGFSRKDNCGYSYFPIEFQGVNAKGFGDYAAGFAPTCPVADDFDHPLGNTSERLLSTALYHIDNGACPVQSLAAAAQTVSLAPDLQPRPGRNRSSRLVILPK